MRFLRVNMTQQTIRSEDVPKAYAALGGCALTSLIDNEVPATTNPLGPENQLVFAPGYFTGTSLVNTGRLSVGAKSPLTGGIKESNVGGTVAFSLARLGIAAVIIEGKAAADTSFLLHIAGDGTANSWMPASTKVCGPMPWSGNCAGSMATKRASPASARPATCSCSPPRSSPPISMAAPAGRQDAVDSERLWVRRG